MKAKEIRQEYLTGERALFQGANLKVCDSIFADGESPLKESHDIELEGCMFKSSGRGNHCPVYGNPPAFPKRRGGQNPGSVGKSADVSFFFCDRDYESGGDPDLSICLFLVWHCGRKYV